MKENKNIEALSVIKNVKDVPMILPEMDKVELFNLTQESLPVSDLAGKKFKILGIMPEFVEVPKKSADDYPEGFIPEDADVELVERLCITLITDIGVYRSFSVTFNKSLVKAINMFPAGEFANLTYEATLKMKDKKAYYSVKIVK